MDMDKIREFIATVINRTDANIYIFKGIEIGTIKVSELRESCPSAPYQLTGKERNLAKQLYPPMSERWLSDAKQKLFQSVNMQKTDFDVETLVDERMQGIIKRQGAMLKGVSDSMIITIHDNALFSRDRNRISRRNGIRNMRSQAPQNRPQTQEFDFYLELLQKIKPRF